MYNFTTWIRRCSVLHSNEEHGIAVDDKKLNSKLHQSSTHTNYNYVYTTQLWDMCWPYHSGLMIAKCDVLF